SSFARHVGSPSQACTFATCRSLSARMASFAVCAQSEMQLAVWPAGSRAPSTSSAIMRQVSTLPTSSTAAATSHTIRADGERRSSLSMDGILSGAFRGETFSRPARFIAAPRPGSQSESPRRTQAQALEVQECRAQPQSCPRAQAQAGVPLLGVVFDLRADPRPRRELRGAERAVEHAAPGGEQAEAVAAGDPAERAAERERQAGDRVRGVEAALAMHGPDAQRD